MSYWGYVMQSLMNEDRDAPARRTQRRRRLRREREEAVLRAAADALPKDVGVQSAPRRNPISPVRVDVSSTRRAG